MKCPECGFELAEGQLYCEKCGKEIQIVPDFEPEIENSIIETLSTVAEAIEPKLNSEPTVDGTVDGKEALRNGESLGERVEIPVKNSGLTGNKVRQVIGFGSFILLIVVALIIGINIYQSWSVTYQIEQAEKYAAAGDYARATEYMERAAELLPDNIDIKNTLAAYYYFNQDPDQAIDTMMDVVKEESYSSEEKEKSYEQIIKVLDEQQRFQEINDLLKSSEDEALMTKFQYYLAKEPEFSVSSGSYSEVILLKLDSNTAGNIYYTMNGSRPTTDSKVYTAPIFLEAGEYIVSAMFINEYGIESEIVSHSYQIDLQIPEPPAIAIYSGLYSEATMIEVELPAQGEVYYTTNGNMPTIDSLHYTEPIAMPYGRTEFNFVVISAEGVTSEVVSRIFEFRLPTEISEQAAVTSIMKALIGREILDDMSGKASFEEGFYEYAFDDLVVVPGKGYYFKVDEYYRIDEGLREKTEHLYAVEAFTGAPNRLIYNEQGQMDLISLE